MLRMIFLCLFTSFRDAHMNIIIAIRSICSLFEGSIACSKFALNIVYVLILRGNYVNI